MMNDQPPADDADRRATKPPKTRLQRGKAGVRAAFADVTAELEVTVRPSDPPADAERNGVKAGQWPGYPTETLPPDCPVVPLGISGKTHFFVDTSGQLMPVTVSEWGHKILLALFAGRHQYLHWAWPRFNAKTFQINGLEVNEAMSCLVSEASKRGIFSPAERVRGRGAWLTRQGLVWHGGDRIFRVVGGRLEAAPPGEIDGIFYPNLPRVTVPWREPIATEESPAHLLLDGLASWTWERPGLDPILVVGWIAAAFLGGALDFRPHLFTTGDKGVGKSTLHALVKSLLGQSVLSTADTTPAGIYQRVKLDCLPVAIDELEATEDNRRAKAIVSLARLASSGALMYRGGAEHEGVEFQLRNTFFMSSINPPPMTSADKSRLAMLNLGKLDPTRARKPPVIDVDVAGRQILRQLMDGWPRFAGILAEWRDELYSGGITDGRGLDTWGTLFALAELLVGKDGLERAGLPMSEGAVGYVGARVAAATANERAEATENWVDCLSFLLGSTIEAWKSGEKPTVGTALEKWEAETWSLSETNERLALVGLRLLDRWPGSTDKGRLLAVPVSAAQAPNLAALFRGQRWAESVWASALKQAPKEVVVRDLGNHQNVRINRVTTRCLLVDLEAYDVVMKKETEG